MSIRTERVAKLVQQDVADILANELDHELPALFTVTGVRMTCLLYTSPSPRD